MNSSKTVDEAALSMYAKEIEILASEGKNEDFFNSGKEHAMIVLKNIAKYAKSDINIYAANLCTEVSNNEEYIANLSGFIKKGGLLNVLLCDYPKSDTHLEKDIYKLFKENKDKITVKKTEHKVVATNSGKQLHFTIADGKAYRLEFETEKKVAKGNFDDTSTSKYLNSKFFELFNNPDSELVCF